MYLLQVVMHSKYRSCVKHSEKGGSNLTHSLIPKAAKTDPRQGLTEEEFQSLKSDYHVHKTIEAIVDGSRLQELQFAVDAVMDDDYRIIVGEINKATNATAKAHRSVLKKSVFKGVSMNGKKWQVSDPKSLTR